MSTGNTISGGCLCTACQFEVRLPSKWCAHCHCTMCRKAHGAGFVTWVGFESDQFQWTRGEETVRWHQSSAEARRAFCSECGSTMLFESKRWAGETHVAVGCLDGELDRKPQANVFISTHVDWMPLDESLKALDP